MKLLIDSFQTGIKEKRFLTSDQLSATYEAESITYKIQPLLQRLENRLHGWVAYFIMPVFALANAGVSLTNINGSFIGFSSLSLSIGLSLFFGKIIGVSLFSWLSIKTKIAALPSNTNFTLILGAGIVSAIGFLLWHYLSIILHIQILP